MREFTNISKREHEVVFAIAQGMNSKEISSELDISVHTVETHRKNLMRKLNARNTAHLVHLSCCEGIIPIAYEN